MEYSSNFIQVVEQAKNHSNGIINPSHLFMGLISVKGCVGYQILSRVIDVVDAEKKMKMVIGDQSIDTKDREKIIPKMTMEAENILLQSQLEAKKFKSDIVRTEHLLLAMTRARVIDILTYRDIEKIVNEMNGNVDEYNELNKETNMGEETKQPTVPNKKTKTPILDEFSTDLTKLAKENKLDPTVGRKKELRRIAQVLSRRKKNNPVLIGDPGCVIGDTLITIRKISNENNHNIIIIKNDL